MSGINRIGSLPRSGKPLKRSPLKKRGHKTKLWEVFSAKKAEKDRNEEGLIKCQDYKLGLPACNESLARPDLHHLVGRDERPDLYFADENLIWLTRECHRAAHNNG